MHDAKYCPREPTKEMIDAAVDRFLAWPLPKGFAPDCGISFDGRKDDEWNKNKSWPIGTNLFTADQARSMFQHALAAPAQAEPRVEHVCGLQGFDPTLGDPPCPACAPAAPAAQVEPLNPPTAWDIATNNASTEPRNAGSPPAAQGGRDLDAPAYRVEPSPDGCQHCESGKLWDVIGPDGVAQGVSFNDEVDADEYATALNAAYLAGAARSADAIAALRASAEGWEADAQRYALNADYWRARAERAEADAERYQHMRKANADEWSRFGHYTVDELDAAIDRARTQGGDRETNG